jgi:hypothetical protein
VVKEFLVNFINSLKPEYIYSIEEKPTNEINENILRLVRYLAKQVVALKPEFLIEITHLFESYEDYDAIFNKNYKGIVVELLKVFDINDYISKYIVNRDKKNFNEGEKRDKMNVMKLVSFIYTTEKNL